MTKTNLTLLGLLAVQVGWIVLSGMTSEEAVGFERTLVVADMVAEDILAVDITAAEESVRLERAGADAPWTVASEDGWRGDGEKIDRALGEVLGLETADLIATGEDHHVDLKVADADFERKLVLTTASGAKEVVFGTAAPGSGVHLRRGGEPEVYAVRDFSTWKLGTATNGWIDRTYLELPRDRISDVVIETDQRYAFAHGEDGWTVAIGEAEPVPAVQEKVDSILGKLARVTLSEVHGTAPPAAAEGEVRVTATVAAGEDGPARTVSLRLVPRPADPAPEGDEPKEPERWFVRADTETHTVEVGRWAVRPLVEIEPSALVEDSEKPGQD